MNCNADDQRRWDELFTSVPPEWKDAPPSEVMKACLKFFVDHAVTNALDAGCGVGRSAVYLTKNGINVKAADFSPNAITFAKTWASDENLNIVFGCHAITEEAFPGERFDGAIAAFVLDNVSCAERERAVSVIRMSLNEGGCLFALFNPLLTCAEEEERIESGNPTAGITSMDLD